MICIKCLEEKDPSEFHKTQRTCKACRKGTGYGRDWYQYKYGVSKEFVDNLKKEQEYKCACCGIPTERLVVDHCHITYDIRGLLCDKCNTGIGLLGDNLQGVMRAVHYLST
jgi:hypothetical protein